jgi:hypothetical protein
MPSGFFALERLLFLSVESSKSIPLFKAVWGTRLTGLVCIALSLYFGNLALEFPAGGGTFPIFAAGGTIFLALILIAASFIKTSADKEEMFRLDISYNGLKTPLLIVISILYIIGITEIGYFVTSIAFLYITTYAVGIRNFKAVTLTALFLFPTMYGFFVVILHAQFPRGILF